MCQKSCKPKEIETNSQKKAKVANVLLAHFAHPVENWNIPFIDFFLNIEIMKERKTFNGHWNNGKREGPGKMVWLNGEEYNGEWKNNLQQGQGEHRFPSGHYDIAMWDQGLRHGPAVYYHPNGGKEECTYVEGYENGPSTVYFAK